MKHIDVEDCDHVETVNLDLKNIRVQKYEGHTNLLLLDKNTNVKIKMRYPKYKDILRLQQGQGDFDSFMEVLINCTEMVTQNDDVFMMKDFSDKDKKDFFLNFNLTHMESVKSFFDTMPKVCYDLEWTCSKCGKKESHTIEGVQSFLS